MRPPTTQQSEAIEAAGPMEETSRGGQDAVCFSAGLAGAVFGTGAIHAYLAANRKHPAIAAGISFGALCAAALQRCYRHLSTKALGENPTTDEVESARWFWFRRFLRVVTDRPLAPLWRALPGRSDFFAGFETIPENRSHENGSPLEGEEAAKKRDILVKLGRWIAQLPISVREISQLISAYVRLMQAKNVFTKLNAVTYLFLRSLWTLDRLAFFVLLQPLLILSKANPRNCILFGWRVYLLTGFFAFTTVVVILALLIVSIESLWLPHPWWAWLISAVALISLLFTRIRPLIALPLVIAMVLFYYFDPPPVPLSGTLTTMFVVGWFFLRISSLIIFLLVIYEKPGKKKPGKRKLRKLVDLWNQDIVTSLRLANGFVDAFYIEDLIRRLFEDSGSDPHHQGATDSSSTVNNDDLEPFPIVIVATALQPLKYVRNDQKEHEDVILDRQLFALPGAPLVESLATALRQVKLMGSRSMDSASMKHWMGDRMEPWKGESVNLVAGSLTRRNPLPALFQYLRYDCKLRSNSSVKSQLTNCTKRGQRAIHVLYEVPLKKTAVSEEHGGPEEGKDAEPDIVDVGFLGARLASRQDTQMEVKQTNFLSRLEHALSDYYKGSKIRPYGQTDGFNDDECILLFADEISPENHIGIEAFLNPKTKHMMCHVAQGCRRTLETLYAQKLSEIGRSQKDQSRHVVACDVLLRKIARGRSKWIRPESPGLKEVCAACKKELRFEAPDKDRKIEYEEDTRLHLPRINEERFSTLSGTKPRIVLVASGGVFRGAFHIGLVAALRAVGVRPDLVAGASVGTLLGGTLGSLLTMDGRIRAGDAECVRASTDSLLGDLVDSFVEVDEKVALTRRFLRAMREIAMRASSIDLSPSQVRRMVHLGSRKDPGFAATGAPPALIDAISTLFMLPYRITAEIASSFVAGHYGRAAFEFGQAVKKETLRRLEIERAIVGRSFLEQVALGVFGKDATGRSPSCIDLCQEQPFYWKDENEREVGVAFVATATNLITEDLCCLGMDEIIPNAPYDFLKGALASSAFPAVFAPVRESEIFPGLGSNSVYYSDGGMFDNLPFIPAVDALVDSQKHYCMSNDLNPLQFLQDRHERPDLFLVASLGVKPKPEDRFREANRRPYLRGEGAFHEQVKIRSFDSLSIRIDKQCNKLNKIDASKADDAWLKKHRKTLNGTVNGAILPIHPMDKDHLNGTFAFCAAVGLRKEKVCRSIAHGCFQTLRGFAEAAKARRKKTRDDDVSDGEDLLARAFAGLRKDPCRLPRIVSLNTNVNGEGNICPYFGVLEGSDDPDRIHCPFAILNSDESVHGQSIFKHCCNDPSHLGEE